MTDPTRPIEQPEEWDEEDSDLPDTDILETDLEATYERPPQRWFAETW